MGSVIFAMVAACLSQSLCQLEHVTCEKRDLTHVWEENSRATMLLARHCFSSCHDSKIFQIQAV